MGAVASSGPTRPSPMGSLAGLAFIVGLAWSTAAPAAETDAVARGRYLFDAGGCAACHTDFKNKGPLLAGGRALKTPFGVFYSPNITPDPEHGIGGWTVEDFMRAMRQGLAPDGTPYFPVFPYPSYTGITDDDLRDLRAYIFSLAPVAKPNRGHQVKAPFGWRFLLYGWRWLYFEPGPFRPHPERGKAWNRGAYLVEALAHCAQCHTPRNALGALDPALSFAGNPDGPEGDLVPNITPHRETGIGGWTDDDLDSLFRMGMTPDGDFVGGSMAEVVEHTTGRLGESDLRAVIVYLRALPPIRHVIESKKKGS